jgi:hypothetical protein
MKPTHSKSSSHASQPSTHSIRAANARGETTMKTTHTHATHATHEPKEETTMKKTTDKTAHAHVHATKTAVEVAPVTDVPAAPTPTPAPAAASTSTSTLVTLPTEDQVTQWVNLLEGVRTMLGNAASPLTTDQRRHAAYPKKGAESTVGLMTGLGKQYSVQLPGIDPAQLQQMTLLVSRLQPLETKLRVISGLVTDTVTNAKTQSWGGATALYTALGRASKKNPALQKELEPAVTFFKKARRASGKSKKGGAAVATPEAVAATSAPPPTGPAAAAAPAAPATVTTPPAATASSAALVPQPTKQ